MKYIFLVVSAFLLSQCKQHPNCSYGVVLKDKTGHNITTYAFNNDSLRFLPCSEVTIVRVRKSTGPRGVELYTKIDSGTGYKVVKYLNNN